MKKRMLAMVVGLIGLISLVGCYSTTTITEFDPTTGTKVKVTETRENVIEALAAQNKDKTFIVFREEYAVGIMAQPSTETMFTLKCAYAHGNTGLVSMVKEQQNVDKIADLIKAMKQTDAISAGPTGVSSGASK